MLRQLFERGSDSAVDHPFLADMRIIRIFSRRRNWSITSPQDDAKPIATQWRFDLFAPIKLNDGLVIDSFVLSYVKIGSLSSVGNSDLLHVCTSASDSLHSRHLLMRRTACLLFCERWG